MAKHFLNPSRAPCARQFWPDASNSEPREILIDLDNGGADGGEQSAV